MFQRILHVNFFLYEILGLLKYFHTIWTLLSSFSYFNCHEMNLDWKCCYVLRTKRFDYSCVKYIFTFFYFLLIKQTYIPLQSFNVERPKDLQLCMTPRNHRKYNTELLEKYSKHFNLPKSGESNDFPVLKIEEDFDDIPMTNGTCKTISTQTSPINEMNGGRTNGKKGSSNSLWTSDESILRSGETVDEDTKSSSSSSACEETGGVISSGKSGKIYLIFLEVNISI